MPQSLAHVTLLVRNYEEALAFFTEALAGSLSLRPALAAQVCSSHKRTPPSKSNKSAIKPVAASSFFSIPMISCGITV